jgi:plasmid stabilization system protein ParE
MRIVIRQKADDDLDKIFDWICRDDPAAAVLAIKLIREDVHRLAIPGMHEMGRPGRDTGTQELINNLYNVIIVYEIHHAKEQVVEVLAIFRGTQDR